MGTEEGVVTIRIATIKRGLYGLVGAGTALLVAAATLGVGSSADAAGPKRLCVKGTKVIQRTSCKGSERNLAAGKLTSINKTSITLTEGSNTMRKAGAVSTAPGARTATVSGLTFEHCANGFPRVGVGAGA